MVATIFSFEGHRRDISNDIINDASLKVSWWLLRIVKFQSRQKLTITLTKSNAVSSDIIH